MHGTRADIQKSYGEGEVHESEAQTVGVCLRCRFQAAAGLHGHLKVQRVQNSVIMQTLLDLLLSQSPTVLRVTFSSFASVFWDRLRSFRIAEKRSQKLV